MAAEDRLEKLQHDIEEARRKAHDAQVLDDPNERRYSDSGELSDFDDQTITPPG